MELTVLGMNGPFPAANGATSGYLMRGEKTRMAMDMGSGTLGRLTALMPPEKLDALLLSHWHFDHCSDVLPLLFRLQACAAKPLDVYAPVDESSMVRKVVQQNSAFCLHDVQKDDKVQLGEFSVRVFAARHPVPGVMYRVTDGEKTLCYTGDTNTVEGLTDFAQDADLLLADGLFPTEMWQEGLPHLSAAQTAELARDARVKKLVITHLNPNIDPETLLKQARATSASRFAKCARACAVRSMRGCTARSAWAKRRSSRSPRLTRMCSPTSRCRAKSTASGN